MRKPCSMFLLVLGLLLVSAPGSAARHKAEDKAQPTEVPLKDRVKIYYKNILNGDRVAALEMVAPESRNQFFNIRYDGLADVRILSYDFEQAEDRVEVKVIRVSKVPGFGQALDLQFTDIWQRMNGQWFLVLPVADEMDTPFGRIKTKTDSKQAAADAEALKQKIQQRYQTVDPDQYIRALQKLARKQAAAESKTDDKQSPPAPQGDKSKPQQ